MKYVVYIGWNVNNVKLPVSLEVLRLQSGVVTPNYFRPCLERGSNWLRSRLYQRVSISMMFEHQMFGATLSLLLGVATYSLAN
jgi:hypothetical protein